MQFAYEALAGRTLFGSGAIDRIGDEVAKLGCARALVLSTPGRTGAAERIMAILGDRAAGLHPGAVMHTPVDATLSAMEVVRESGADCLIAVGGGSAIGLAKAIALRTDLPQIAVPTTYAGSEATPVVGQTEDGVKTTVRDLRVLPEVIVYDVDLTLNLPRRLTATSALNAMAHAVEALYAQNANPVTEMMAAEGLRRLGSALDRLANSPADRAAREDALYGAWLCGICLATAGMALHHKICHVLGGSFGLSHGDVHAVMLPHCTAFNAPAAPDAMARVADALGGDPASRLYDMGAGNGAPVSLAEIGMKGEDIDRAVEIALRNSYWNPRPIDAEGLRGLLQRAYAGERP